MSLNIPDFGTNSSTVQSSSSSTPSSDYNANPTLHTSVTSNLTTTSPTSSSDTSAAVTNSHGNLHATTSLPNPIHRSKPQSIIQPAFENSSFSSPYEAGSRIVRLRHEEGAGGQDSGEEVGHGQDLGGNYQRNFDPAYGHAVGPTQPKTYGGGEEMVKPYDTGVGKSKPSSANETGAPTQASNPGFINPSANARLPYNSTPGFSSTTGDENGGSAPKAELTTNQKGVYPATHATGGIARGTFKAGVDRTFKAVVTPSPLPFPSLRPLGHWAGEEDGEFPSSVYEVEGARDLSQKVVFRKDSVFGKQKGRYFLA